MALTGNELVALYAVDGAGRPAATQELVAVSTIAGTLTAPVEIFGSPASTGTLPTLPAGTVLVTVSPNGTRTLSTAFTFGGGLTTAYPGFAGVRALGTMAAPTTVLNTTVLVGFTGIGYDGTAYSTPGNGAAAQWALAAAEDWAVGAHGTQATLSLTPVGTASVASVLIVSSAKFLSTSPIVFGTNVAVADASAAIDVQSTTKGALWPRMTQTQRDAIVAPAESLVIYNLTTHKLNLRTAAAWEEITSV